jgi:hypothetical protein
MDAVDRIEKALAAALAIAEAPGRPPRLARTGTPLLVRVLLARPAQETAPSVNHA